MVIDENILLTYGATVKKFAKKEIVFSEGSTIKNYFQIRKGILKICNSFDDGKEYVHGFPFEGHCFGESYLYTEKSYGITAIAITNCSILVLSKEAYLKMVRDNPEILLSVNEYTAERLHFRYFMSSFSVITDPVSKITMLMDYLKSYFKKEEPYTFQVPFTRSNLAGLTGLRIETVIRTIKKMQAQKVLKIKNGKIYYQIAFLMNCVMI